MAALDHPMTLDEIATELAEVQGQLNQIEADNAGVRFTDDVRESWNQFNTRRDELVALRGELETRARRIAEIATNPDNVEGAAVPQFPRPGVVRGEDIWDLSTVRSNWNEPEREASEFRDRALRAIDQVSIPYTQGHITVEDAQSHMAHLVDNIHGAPAMFSRHLLNTGSPQYRRAFTKYLSGQPRSQSEDDMLYRAASLTGTSGGFAVPFMLDPTILPTDAGSVNPYRSISSVTQITGDEWRGVSADAPTAAFQAEAAEVTDLAPTFAQPTVSTEMGRVFIPFSIEIGMDWSGFASEMGALIADSKDNLEATKFAVGNGTNEPFGVITGATSVFTASNTNSVVVADIYGVQGALGPRFRSRAVWTMNNAVANKIRQLDTAGGANLWINTLRDRSSANVATFTDARFAEDLLGKPAYEASGQASAITTGQLIAVFGDFSRYYKIIDRIGMNIETIPHLFATANNLPSGQRGLFAYWRTGGKVMSAAAFKTLKLA